MSFDLHTSTAYMAGEFVPFDRANVSIASSPVLYGLTIYTVFNVRYDKEAGELYTFRLKEHYQRLVNSASIMDFGQFIDDWDFEKFSECMHELLRCNKIAEDVLVRVAVYVDELIAGTRIHGLKNSVSAYVYPFGQILPVTGVNLCVSSWQRTADNAMPSRAKINGSYINASLMKNEALLNGYDDAIAIDHNGHVTEGTVANLFLVRGDTLITPDNSADLLEGITRDSIVTIAGDAGYAVQQRSVDRSELYIADEAFLCGSSARITPVLSIDKRRTGSGAIGPVTAKLQQAYAQVQTDYAANTYGWLTKVS